MKNYFRKFLRARRDSLTREEVLEKSRTITEVLIHSDIFQKSGSVFVYLDVKNEVSTRFLIEHCFEINKPVFVPVTCDNEIFFSKLEDFSDLVKAAYGIPEPAHPVAAEPDKSSLIIVPGVGFDVYGNRIGYGAGYYDKYLQGRIAMHLIGICFEIQLTDELPTEKTDVQLDSILTENQWITVEKEQR